MQYQNNNRLDSRVPHIHASLCTLLQGKRFSIGDNLKPKQSTDSPNVEQATNYEHPISVMVISSRQWLAQLLLDRSSDCTDILSVN